MDYVDLQLLGERQEHMQNKFALAGSKGLDYPSITAKTYIYVYGSPLEVHTHTFLYPDLEDKRAQKIRDLEEKSAMSEVSAITRYLSKHSFPKNKIIRVDPFTEVELIKAPRGDFIKRDHSMMDAREIEQKWLRSIHQ